MKAMTDFDGAKKFRTGLNQQGMPMIIPWAKAFKKLYANTYFLGVTEDTRDIAEIYTERGLEQSDFDKGVELRKDATEKQVCEHILGHPLRESTIESIEQIKNDTEMLLKESKSLIDESYKKDFTYEMLSKYDPRNAIMGLYTSCCATITSGFYGRSIAEASVLSDDVQNLVVLDRNGEIIGKGTLYVNKEKGYAVFNDFEIHKNYRKHETDAGIYDTNTESQIQCENERELIFCALMRGVRDFVKDWDLQHPDKPIQQVNVGMGYNRLKAQCQRFKKATQNLSVPIEYEFRDAQDEQYVLYDRKSEIKKGGLQL